MDSLENEMWKISRKKKMRDEDSSEEWRIHWRQSLFLWGIGAYPGRLWGSLAITDAWELAAVFRKIRNSLFISFQNLNTFNRQFNQNNNSPPQCIHLDIFSTKKCIHLESKTPSFLYSYMDGVLAGSAQSDKWWTFHCCLQQYQPNPHWFSFTSNLVV